jgi:hypothetical protein
LSLPFCGQTGAIGNIGKRNGDCRLTMKGIIGNQPHGEAGKQGIL